ncbi:hypothetical protein [Lysobacter silvisoli]|uniref:Ribosomal protein L7/L12 C-terminal domain-containing protein n=1 Tax=Lysobacter silvisoli TaxID=2293254 RepID=A0A371K6F6_9GAMM|nr:hypothetical protein [Lysobacter silvisoli]RDZ29539.1 hypothetical protein DX914_10825 [Lysobacter silvisoli]
MVDQRKIGISPEAAAAVARGDLIVAIKLVREANRVDLRSAKEAVEAWRDSRPLPDKAAKASSASAGGLPAKVLLALSQGKTLEAIKLLHESGLDLRSAKQRIDAHLQTHPVKRETRASMPVTQRPPTVQEERNDHRVVAAALIAVAIAVFAYVWDAGWL